MISSIFNFFSASFVNNSNFFCLTNDTITILKSSILNRLFLFLLLRRSTWSRNMRKRILFENPKVSKLNYFYIFIWSFPAIRGVKKTYKSKMTHNTDTIPMEAFFWREKSNDPITKEFRIRLTEIHFWRFSNVNFQWRSEVGGNLNIVSMVCIIGVNWE